MRRMFIVRRIFCEILFLFWSRFFLDCFFCFRFFFWNVIRISFFSNSFFIRSLVSFVGCCICFFCRRFFFLSFFLSGNCFPCLEILGNFLFFFFFFWFYWNIEIFIKVILEFKFLVTGVSFGDYCGNSTCSSGSQSTNCYKSPIFVDLCQMILTPFWSYPISCWYDRI